MREHVCMREAGRRERTQAGATLSTEPSMALHDPEVLT